MKPAELLHSLQGDMSQSEFAAMIGVSQSLLSMIYSGERNPGRAVMMGVIHAFPDKRDLAVSVFLSPEYDKTSESMTTIGEAAS
jgi:transcriptional regulator with XRE-family HTH domain